MPLRPLTSETVSGLRPEHRNHSGSGSVAFPRAVLQNELDQTQVPALVAEQRKGLFPASRIFCLVFCVGVKSICQVHCGAGHVLQLKIIFKPDARSRETVLLRLLLVYLVCFWRVLESSDDSCTPPPTKLECVKSLLH